MSQSKGRILCTEDDADTRDLLTIMLGLSDYEVTCADNALEALELIRTEKFDLLLLDNWMPGVSGETLCQQIREFDSRTPILFYSGAALEADKERARDAGAQGYLVKPVIESELIAEVVRIIAESNLGAPVAVVPPEQSRPVKLGE